MIWFEREKRSTSGGSPQYPNGFSGQLLFHLIFNQNFRILWLNWSVPIDSNPVGFARDETRTVNMALSIRPKIPQISTGANATKISWESFPKKTITVEFPKCEPFSWKIQKILAAKSNGTKICVYIARLSSSSEISTQKKNPFWCIPPENAIPFKGSLW